MAIFKEVDPTRAVPQILNEENVKSAEESAIVFLSNIDLLENMTHQIRPYHQMDQYQSSQGQGAQMDSGMNRGQSQQGSGSEMAYQQGSRKSVGLNPRRVIPTGNTR